MAELNDELTLFARAIVQGEAPSARITSAYVNYAAEVAIEVYRNNYRGNLHDALAGAYPVVKQLVGDEFFRFMARNYIESHPSRSANLHQFGEALAGFVAGFAPARELVYLADVAALEWAYHCAYFAADEAELDVAKLMQVQPAHYESLKLHVQPACRVLASPYPVVAIWQAHQAGADRDFQIGLGSGTCIALVCRTGRAVQIAELSEAEADWLCRIDNGQTLGVATTATLARYPGFELQASLLKLVALQLFTNFEIGATS